MKKRKSKGLLILGLILALFLLPFMVIFELSKNYK